jgi:hypothetical protein
MKINSARDKQDRTLILVVGMLDSPHLASWLKRFEKQKDYIFVLFPSRQFRKINKELSDLIESKPTAFILSKSVKKIRSLHLVFRILQVLSNNKNIVIKYLSRLLCKELQTDKWDFVHLFEMQGAGYVFLECYRKLRKETDHKVVYSNYGSDISWYGQYPVHNVKIREVLAKIDLYVAECPRDIALAREYGYGGKFCPMVPNSTHFSNVDLEMRLDKPSNRNLILVKAYGGAWGYGNVILDGISKFLVSNLEARAYAFSVTGDVLKKAYYMKLLFGSRFDFSTIYNPLSRMEMFELFRSARFYVGYSRSEGISTSALESMVFGAFPIQTATSCLGSIFGSEITIFSPDDFDPDIFSLLTELWPREDFLNEASAKNRKRMRSFLDEERIWRATSSCYIKTPNP